MQDESENSNITALQLEHEQKLYHSRIGLMKVIFGTMVVGLAAAFFPFAQKWAEVTYQERIEKIKAESQITIIDREHDLKKQEIEFQSNIATAEHNAIQIAAMREFLNDLALEGRSSDIETRIRLAEYFSFVAGSEEERERWAEFRRYLSQLHDERRQEREKLRRIELDENANPVDRILAREGIIVIDREIAPKTVFLPTEPASEAVLFEVLDINRLTVNGDLTRIRQPRLVEALGQPHSDPDNVQCKMPDDPALLSIIETDRIGAFSITLLQPALNSLREIFAGIEKYEPDLINRIGSTGGLCVRFVRGSTTLLSLNSWGIAIDLTVDGRVDRRGDNRVLPELARIAPYFIENGWFWGAGYLIEESSQFAVSEGLFDNWIEEQAIAIMRAE